MTKIREDPKVEGFMGLLLLIYLHIMFRGPSTIFGGSTLIASGVIPCL